MNVYVIVPLSLAGGGGVLAGLFWILNDIRKGLRSMNGDLRNVTDNQSRLVDLSGNFVRMAEQQQNFMARLCGEHATQEEKLEHIEEAMGAIHRRFDEAIVRKER